MADAADTEARVLRELFVYTMVGPSLPMEEAGPFASRIGAAMLDMHLAAGEVVYREGEFPEHLYFIVTGQLQLAKEGSAKEVLGDRTILGMDALLARPRTRTAVALSDVHLLKVDAETWLSAVEDTFAAARGGILKMSEVVQKLELAWMFNQPERARAAPIGDSAAGAAARVAAPLPAKLALVDRILSLREVDLFRRGHMQAITMLAELADEIRLAEGEALFAKHEVARAIYLVVLGEVSLSDGQEKHAVVAAGSVVGGTGAMAVPLAIYEARATVATIVLRVRLEDYWDVLEEHVDLVRSAMVALAQAMERLKPLA